MWSRYVVFMLLIMVALGCVSTSTVGSAPPAPYDTPTNVDVQVFYDELAPYGTWLWLEGQGRVWSPQGVPPGWRPYTVGRWVYTDVGWTWVSDWEWGWAPFHYGRWTYSPAYGWVWAPDTVWGPAWVVWHHGPGWVGWAPLPPAAVWEPHGGLSITYIETHVPPSSYCFVREQHLLAPHVHRHIVPPAENVRLVHVTKNVTNYTIINKQVINQSVQVESIEQAAKQPVRRMRLVEAESSQRGYQGRVKDKEGQVTVFRPRIARSTPDAGTPPSQTPSQPVVSPRQEPLTRPEVIQPRPGATPAPPATVQGKESPTRPEMPATTEPPKRSAPQRQEPQRQHGRPPAALSQPPQAPPLAPAPQVRTPPEEPQEKRDKDQSRQPRLRTRQDNESPTTAQPPARPATPPAVGRAPVVTPSPHQQPPAGALLPSPGTPQERREKKPPQRQPEKDKDDSTQGSATVPPTGAVPPALGAGANPLPRPAGPRGRQ